MPTLATSTPPDRLWDYLRVNLEPSIMASPDGHRWALAVDALERCLAMGGDELHLRLLKTIALVDMFKERSGLMPSVELLEGSLPGCDSTRIADALAELQGWSLIIYRKFNGSYSVFEGSDFDIDESVGRVMAAMDVIDFHRLNDIAGLQPMVAKRHYHDTGSLRWFDMAIVPLSEVEEAVPRHGAVGAFYLAILTRGESPEAARKIARRAADSAEGRDVVVGLPQIAWDIMSLARELLALERVRDGTPELLGDRVARSEVLSRVAALQGHIEGELGRAFDNALWFSKGREPSQLPHAKLNSLASDLADERFDKAPRLHNELLNRVKPSSNAVAAQNALLRRMVINEGEERLGIKEFPAEGGLFESILELAGLYRQTPTGWRFVSPALGDGDCCNLAPTWLAALNLLEGSSHRTVSVAEIYAVWREPPFGIRDGSSADPGSGIHTLQSSCPCLLSAGHLPGACDRPGRGLSGQGPKRCPGQVDGHLGRVPSASLGHGRRR